MIIMLWLCRWMEPPTSLDTCHGRHQECVHSTCIKEERQTTQWHGEKACCVNCLLWKIFCKFNFHSQLGLENYFHNENFPIYGISCYQNNPNFFNLKVYRAVERRGHWVYFDIHFNVHASHIPRKISLVCSLFIKGESTCRYYCVGSYWEAKIFFSLTTRNLRSCIHGHIHRNLLEYKELKTYRN